MDVGELGELTEGLGADVTIEAVGVPETFELAVDLVRPGGHVANVGVHGKGAILHLEREWIRDITVTTGLVDTFSTPQLLKLVASGRLDPTVFATHRFALGDTMEAYDVFGDAARTGALKVVLEGAERPDGVTAAAAGCRAIVLTNAAGCLHREWPPGTPVLIGDHAAPFAVTRWTNLHFPANGLKGDPIGGPIPASIGAGVTVVPTARNLARQNAEIDALRDKIVSQQQQLAELKAEEERWADPAYVEQQARQRLKYCLLYTSPSPRDRTRTRMPSPA